MQADVWTSSPQEEKFLKPSLYVVGSLRNSLRAIWLLVIEYRLIVPLWSPGVRVEHAWCSITSHIAGKLVVLIYCLNKGIQFSIVFCQKCVCPGWEGMCSFHIYERPTKKKKTTTQFIAPVMASFIRFNFFHSSSYSYWRRRPLSKDFSTTSAIHHSWLNLYPFLMWCRQQTNIKRQKLNFSLTTILSRPKMNLGLFSNLWVRIQGTNHSHKNWAILLLLNASDRNENLLLLNASDGSDNHLHMD